VAGSLIPLLTTVGYSLPELLGCGIALAMVWTGATPGRLRTLGLAGLGMMLACVLLQLAIGLYQNRMIQSDGSALDLQGMFMVLGVVRLLVNCVFLAGLVLLAWALSQALGPRRTGPPLA
jgi:hypothetical protein